MTHSNRMHPSDIIFKQFIIRYWCNIGHRIKFWETKLWRKKTKRKKRISKIWNKQIDKERCVRREKLFIIWNSKQAIVEVPYDASHTYNYIVKEHDKFHCTIYKNGKYFKNIQQVSGQSTLQLLSVIERWYSIFYELNGAYTDTL